MTLVLTSTDAVVAIGGAAVAVVALIACTVLAWTLRGVRVAQRAVLGGAQATDLVGYTTDLEEEVIALRDYLEDVARRLDTRMQVAEGRIDGAITGRGLVRYDAYNEMSGHQSVSLALLDATRSGVVLSSILHRDEARVYVKPIRDGRGELILSPEEEEAVRLALPQSPPRRAS